MSAPDTAERASLALFYDGPALRDSRMSVRDLAPALLGLSDVFQQANEALNPGDAPVSLDITATNQGSFIIELEVIHRRVIDLLTTHEATGLGALLAFVTGGAGLFQFLRSRSRQGSRQETLPSGNVRITQPDGTVIEFDARVLALFRQPPIRAAAQAVIAPVARDGITQMQLRPARNAPPTVTITADDAPAIAQAILDEGESLITDHQYEQTLTIVAPNFNPANKWRLRDGDITYWMAMEDADFVARVAGGSISFRTNDRLRALVRLRQWELPTGDVHTERSVIRVVQHVHSPWGIQMGLDDTDGPEDA